MKTATRRRVRFGKNRKKIGVITKMTKTLDGSFYEVTLKSGNYTEVHLYQYKHNWYKK